MVVVLEATMAPLYISKISATSYSSGMKKHFNISNNGSVVVVFFSKSTRG
jgi:hypothetical protein